MRLESDLAAARRSDSQAAVHALLVRRLSRLQSTNLIPAKQVRAWLLADDSIFVALARSPAGETHLHPVQHYIAGRERVLESRGLLASPEHSWSADTLPRTRLRVGATALASHALDYIRSRQHL